MLPYLTGNFRIGCSVNQQDIVENEAEKESEDDSDNEVNEMDTMSYNGRVSVGQDRVNF